MWCCLFFISFYFYGFYIRVHGVGQALCYCEEALNLLLAPSTTKGNMDCILNQKCFSSLQFDLEYLQGHQGHKVTLLRDVLGQEF